MPDREGDESMGDWRAPSLDERTIDALIDANHRLREAEFAAKRRPDMTEQPRVGGHDTPELVLRVRAAERVPGLWNAELTGPGVSESFYDLTTAQISYVAHERGARIERVG